jgi:hypothetical protein
MKLLHRREFWLMVMEVAVVAAALGYWLFGPLGVALWVPLAIFIAFLIYLFHHFFPRLAITIPLLVASVALYDASTLGWGGADAPDGTRFKASPVGLSHVLSPHQIVSATVDCRWHPASGDVELCAVAPGGEGAYRQLRSVYPLLWVGITICLIEGASQFLKQGRLRFPHRIAAFFAALVPFLALYLFSHSLGRALAILINLEVGTGGSLGTMEMAAAILLCLIAGVLPSACKATVSGLRQ